MGTKISKISVEGFRAFNEQQEVPIGDGITVFFGDNGTGKTSITQAIEWCLTGSLPYLSGPDFTREDAIVNLFNPNKKCGVHVALARGKETMSFSRTRKMGKSTTRGASPLSLQVGSKNHLGDEAEQEAQNVTGIPLGDFSKIIYLHQESIKELLSIDQKERSAGIDRLLGTYELREFTEALDVKRSITSKNNELNERIEIIKRDKIQAAVAMKEELNARKIALTGAGFSEQQLSFGYAIDLLASISEGIEKLGREYEAVPAVHLERADPTLESLEIAVEGIPKAIVTIDRARLQKQSTLNASAINLKNLKTAYEEADKDVKSFGSDTIPSLLDERNKIDAQASEINPRAKLLNDRLGELTRIGIKMKSSSSRISELESKTMDIIRKYLDERGLNSSKDEHEAKILSNEESIKNSARLEQIVGLAIEQISSTNPDSCPVCNQSINRGTVLLALEQKGKKEIRAQIETLRGQQKQLRNELAAIDNDISTIARFRGEISAERNNIASAVSLLSNILGGQVSPNVDIDGETKKISGERDSLNQDLIKLRIKLGELDQKSIALDKAIQKLVGATNKLRAESKSESTGPILVSEVEETIARNEEAAKKYGDATQVEAARGKTIQAEKIFEFLRDKERVRKLEEDLPSANKTIQALEEAIGNLQALDGSLTALRQVALDFGKEAVSNELANLGNVINSYYSKIVRHPVFTQISLQIEKEEPLIYGIQAIGEEATTHIATRFSNAQMNAVAIALFLANNEKLAENLDVILMDDPTQSMDNSHKDALAQIIAELSDKKQIIVATQDSEFLDSMKKNCRSLELHKLGNWSVNGPAIET